MYLLFYLIYSRWASKMPFCLWSLRDLPISFRFTPYDFLSRCKFNTLTTCQPMVNTNSGIITRIELTTSALLSTRQPQTTSTVLKCRKLTNPMSYQPKQILTKYRIINIGFNTSRTVPITILRDRTAELWAGAWGCDIGQTSLALH